MTDVKWVVWAQTLQAIAQTGLTFSKDPYDIERYQQIRAIAVAIVAERTQIAETHVEAVFASGTGYPTPKVDVRAAIFRDQAILLVRERSDALWSLPGGWADIGDSLSQVAVRETLEETGYTVRPTKLFAVFDKARHQHPPSLDYVYKCFVGCTIIGGEPRVSHETDAIAFFRLDNLPHLDDRRVTESQVARMFEHHANPTLATDFD